LSERDVEKAIENDIVNFKEPFQDGITRVGSMVTLKEGQLADGPSNPVWGGTQGKVTGTVVEIKENAYSRPFRVKWSNGKKNDYKEYELELRAWMPFRERNDLQVNIKSMVSKRVKEAVI
jgi:hypothetical protein